MKQWEPAVCLECMPLVLSRAPKDGPNACHEKQPGHCARLPMDSCVWGHSSLQIDCLGSQKIPYGETLPITAHGETFVQKCAVMQVCFAHFKYFAPGGYVSLRVAFISVSHAGRSANFLFKQNPSNIFMSWSLLNWHGHFSLVAWPVHFYASFLSSFPMGPHCCFSV
jgi:hypothetical protein